MNPYISIFFRNTKIWLIACLVLLLTACQGSKIHQTYEGPQKAENEIGTLNIPESFNIIFVDKKKYGASLYSGDTKMGFLPGSHQLLIMYKEFWETPGDEHDRIESKPISITFNVEAGQQYRITYNGPDNINDARSYAKNPSIDLINTASNTSVAANIEYNVYSRSFFENLFNEDDATTEKSAPLPTAEIVSPTPPTPTLAAPKASSSTDTAETEDSRALEMLKYWWETASDNQKKAFQDWLSK